MTQTVNYFLPFMKGAEFYRHFFRRARLGKPATTRSLTHLKDILHAP